MYTLELTGSNTDLVRVNGPVNKGADERRHTIALRSAHLLLQDGGIRSSATSAFLRTRHTNTMPETTRQEQQAHEELPQRRENSCKRRSGALTYREKELNPSPGAEELHASAASTRKHELD